MSYKPLLLVTAPVGTRSGYGAHSRDICRSLIDLDRFDVKIYPVRWGNTPQNALSEQNSHDLPIIKRLLGSPNMDRQPDIHVHIVVPNEFKPIGKYNIGITAGIETTLCPAEWIQGLNKMDLNIVPANFVKETIDRSQFDERDTNTGDVLNKLQISKPVEVLFEGVDTKIYGKTREFSKDLIDAFKPIKEDFCFLFVGHWLAGNLGEDRKDAGSLLKTFLETFKNQKNQPALIMKTGGASPSVLDREEIVNKVNDIKKTVDGDLPNVYFLHGDLRDEEVNQLYNHPKVKAHITFTHGEGFGRPLLEASLSEKPILAPAWGGQIDFLSKDNAFLLPGSLSEVKKDSIPKGMLVQGAQWFTVIYHYCSNVMKEVVKNYSKHIVKGKKLSIINKTRFSLDAMTEKLGKLLDTHLPTFEAPAQQVDLKLPQLKRVSKPKKIELPKLKKV